MQVRLGVLKNWIALLQSCSRLAGVNYQSSSLWCQIRTLEHLRRSSLCQMVERIGEVENHQQKVDAPCTDFVISEKVVECTERTEWAQGLNLEALQTEGQLGQTESCLRRWFADGLKGMTEMSWEQNQKYQSNFGDDLEECGGRSCQMQLTGLIRSEDKLCHSQRLRGGHWDMEKCRLHAVAVMVSRLKSVHEFVLVEMFW